jgi:MOSC domain-containing protein YiiM
MLEGTVLSMFRCPERNDGWDKNIAMPYCPAERVAVKAAQISTNGFEGSDERHFHTSKASFKGSDHNPSKEKGCSDERALLVQSKEHVQALSRHYSYSHTGAGIKGGLYGENLFVEGIHADNVCIGDVFEVFSQGTKTGAVLQVSSPRKPCCKIGGQLKAKNKETKGQEPIKAFCRRTGAGTPPPLQPL